MWTIQDVFLYNEPDHKQHCHKCIGNCNILFRPSTEKANYKISAMDSVSCISANTPDQHLFIDVRINDIIFQYTGSIIYMFTLRYVLKAA